METLFAELKRYVGWSAEHERALQALRPRATPHFQGIADAFYGRILEHEEARQVLLSGESSVGHLKVKLVAWLDRLLTGPWNEEYFELRCRIGRVHVRIGLPQHYMFGAMNVLRDISTKARGIGLGLALVKRIAERHGGEVRYAPRGKGARFVVTLEGSAVA